jgi:hypothetical protein
MKRSFPFVVAALVVAAVAVPMAGMAAVSEPAPAADATAAQTGTNTTNATVAPGERMSGVVGVQKAEVEGEVDRRAFGLQVARAATAESKASVVAGQFGDIEHRIHALEQRKANLTEARQNGSMSEGKYRAQVAELSAKLDSAKELANETAAESEGLPDDLLASKGVNASAIQLLQQRASELGGGEVADIARDIAGPPEDPRETDRRPTDRGPDADRPGNSQHGGPNMPAGDATDATDAASEMDNDTTDAVTNATDDVNVTTDTADDVMNATEETVENTTASVTNTTDAV